MRFLSVLWCIVFIAVGYDGYGQQCANIEVTKEGNPIVINLERVRIGLPLPNGGTRLFNTTNLTVFDIDESVTAVTALSNGILHTFTRQEDSVILIVNEWYITRATPAEPVGTNIFMQDIGRSYLITESYNTVSAELVDCPSGSSALQLSLSDDDTFVSLLPGDTIFLTEGNAINIDLTATRFTIDVDSAYLTADSISFDTSGTGISATNLQEAIEFILSEGIPFDSDRPILRTYFAGLNIGGTTVTDVLEWMYFAAPTMSISQSPSQSVYEVGTSTNIEWTLSTSNPGGATLSDGEFKVTSPIDSVLSTFGSSTNHVSPTLTFTPMQSAAGQWNQHQYQFRGSQDWVSGSESGTVTSAIKTIHGVYPVLYGMSETDYSGGSPNPYGAFSKLVQLEGNKTVTLNGDGFIYYFIPKTWSDFTLSQIIDHNGFDVTDAFTAFDITISSVALTNDYVNVDYRGYKLDNTTTTNNFNYQFIR